MKLKFSIFLVILLSLNSLYAKSNKFPSWYVNPPVEKYPLKDYFMGLAYSDTSYSDAIKKALADIAVQIKAKVKVKTISVKSSIRDNNTEDIKELFGTMSKISSNVELDFFQVVKQEKSNNKFFVLVVINKQKLKNSLVNDINKRNNIIKKYYDNALKLYKEGFLYQSLIDLEDIKKEYPDLISRLKILKDIDINDEHKDLQILTLNEVNKLKLFFIKGIQIKVIEPKNDIFLVTNNQQIRLKVKVIGSFNQPLKNVRLAFFEDNSFVPFTTALTNELGIAEVSILTRYTPYDFKKIIIKIIPNIEEEILKSLLDTKEAIFKYKTNTNFVKDIHIIIQSTSLDNSQKEALKNIVARHLLEYGIKNNPDSQYILKINAELGEFEGLSKTFKRVLLYTSISLLNNNTIIESFTYKYTGLGKSQSSAVMTALKNVKLTEDDINKLIGLLR